MYTYSLLLGYWLKPFSFRKPSCSQTKEAKPWQNYLKSCQSKERPCQMTVRNRRQAEVGDGEGTDGRGARRENGNGDVGWGYLDGNFVQVFKNWLGRPGNQWYINILRVVFSWTVLETIGWKTNIYCLRNYGHVSLTLSDEGAGSFALSSAIHDLFDSKKAWRTSLGRQFLKPAIEGRDLPRKNTYILTRCQWCRKSQVAISRQPFNGQKWEKKKGWKRGSMLHASKAAARTPNSESIEVRISAYKQGKHMGFLGFPGFLTVMKRELWPSAGHMATHMQLPGRTHNQGK